MKAELFLRSRRPLQEGLWAEIVIWRVPIAVRGSRHTFKYRLALIHEDVCVLRYDNEAGKGDHKHIRDIEAGYTFSTVSTLLDDFIEDAEVYRKEIDDAHSDN